MGMKTQEAIAHWGSQKALAEALGLRQPSVAAWGEYPPELRQLQIESVTGGALKAEPTCDKFRVAVA
jgi:DNA-binding transcriptional regulator YdaS (Cro superfamily)